MFSEDQVETPDGWERGTHCGYLSFHKGRYVVYASPKGNGWVRVLLLGTQQVPVETRLFHQRLADAVAGV
jgi:hypothetical protein